MNSVHVGWHFLPADGRLAHGDGRPVVAGEWIAHDGPLVLCSRGLHWSVRAIDALRCAPGPVACRIEARGETIVGVDKRVSTERRVVWMLGAADGELVLDAFARQCAADVLPLWDCPAPEVVMRWLATGGAALRARARDAARDAAWDAAWDAASPAARDAVSAAAAARDAARAAAKDAAWDAAKDAAWDAASAAARDAASAAARDAASAAAAAARDAARAAARDAAWDAQNDRLESWLTAAHEGRWGDIVVAIPEGVEVEP